MLLAESLLGTNAASAPVYIEDVFSTYLYKGAGTGVTIQNGIDLSTKGGLVWTKRRTDAQNHYLSDTDRGTGKTLSTNTTGQELSISSLSVSAFNTDGFSYINGDLTTNGQNYVSWTFRKQAKFFDVVTWTGNGVDGRVLNHSLGSSPGCIIFKQRSNTFAGEHWGVWHRSLGGTYGLWLDLTNGQSLLGRIQATSSSTFTVSDNTEINGSGATYVAYLFAHDAGGFGAAGTDNVITCGGFTASSNSSVNLGWEPQWVFIKPSSAVGNWQILDNMRGWYGIDAASSDAGGARFLAPNLSDTESTTSWNTNLQATGFKQSGLTNGTEYIYIAIRRGPMKTPTIGTSVFGISARTGTGANDTVVGGQVADGLLIKNRGSAIGDLYASRLTGNSYLTTSSTSTAISAATTILQGNFWAWDINNGIKVGTTSTITNASGGTFINYLISRAPGFFDVVSYLGNGSNRTISHSLRVVPELIIVKTFNTTNRDWWVYAAPNGNTNYIELNSNDVSKASSTAWNNTTPTASVFTVGTGAPVNTSGEDVVAWLFASCPGVSKISSYTGTGTTLQIDCGFTGGARFVLIKRTDVAGGWYVWDTARGIVSGNDPYFFLNTTAAEVTSTDYVDTYSAGFEISSTAPAEINASGGTFLFMAIA